MSLLNNTAPYHPTLFLTIQHSSQISSMTPNHSTLPQNYPTLSPTIPQSSHSCRSYPFLASAIPNPLLWQVLKYQPIPKQAITRFPSCSASSETHIIILRQYLIILTDTGDLPVSGTLSKSPRLELLRNESGPKTEN